MARSQNPPGSAEWSRRYAAPNARSLRVAHMLSYGLRSPERVGPRMARFLLGVLSTFVVLAGGVASYLLLGFAEVLGDEPPSGIESRLMRAAVHASVRREAPDLPNPVPP